MDERQLESRSDLIRKPLVGRQGRWWVIWGPASAGRHQRRCREQLAGMAHNSQPNYLQPSLVVLGGRWLLGHLAPLVGLAAPATIKDQVRGRSQLGHRQTRGAAPQQQRERRTRDCRGKQCPQARDSAGSDGPRDSSIMLRISTHISRPWARRVKHQLLVRGRILEWMDPCDREVGHRAS